MQNTAELAAAQAKPKKPGKKEMLARMAELQTNRGLVPFKVAEKPAVLPMAEDQAHQDLAAPKVSKRIQALPREQAVSESATSGANTNMLPPVPETPPVADFPELESGFAAPVAASEPQQPSIQNSDDLVISFIEEKIPEEELNRLEGLFADTKHVDQVVKQLFLDVAKGAATPEQLESNLIAYFPSNDEDQRVYLAEVSRLFGFSKGMAARMEVFPEKNLIVKRFSKQGGMGQVYEAINVDTRERVMLKALVQQPGSSNSHAFQRFWREALTASQVDNSHVAQIQTGDYMPDGSGAWYTSELVPGEDLDRAMVGQPLPTGEVMRMLDQLLDALIAVHGKGIAHRDIKPANIIRYVKDHAFEYKVIDFGLAKPLEQVNDKMEWLRQKLLHVMEGDLSIEELSKYPFSKADLKRVAAIADALAESEAIDELRNGNWKYLLSQDVELSSAYEKMQQVAINFPGGGVEYTYEVFVMQSEQEKRRWARNEILRLSAGDFDASDVEVPQEFRIRVEDRKMIADIAAILADSASPATNRSLDPFSEEIDTVVARMELVNMSMAGAGFGTPGYAAPEQIGGILTDEKSDIFSLGVVAYEASAGQNPFASDDVRAILAQTIGEEPPLLEMINEYIPEALSQLISDMMDKESELRPTAAEARVRLHEIIEAARNTTTQEDAAEPIPQPAAPVTPEAKKKSAYERTLTKLNQLMDQFLRR